MYELNHRRDGGVLHWTHQRVIVRPGEDGRNVA
jgi:hypothetical protein